MLWLQLFILGIICISASSDTPPTEKSLSGNTTQSTESTDSGTEVPTTTAEPSNSTLASCDDNNLNCTSLNATTELAKGDKNDTSSNITENVKNKKQQRPNYSATTNICTCNLQEHFCDVNCCCDPDCSATDKVIFKYCDIDENRVFDDRYCNYIKHIYVNNTPFEWEVNQDGLFCVISSNLPEAHLLQKEKNCPKNICIEVEPKLCDVHLNNCSNVENITNIQFRCSFDIRNNLNSCQNVARKIHYRFYHNGTQGLQGVEVLGFLSNLSYHFGGDDFQFIQEFSLEFLWVNQTKNHSRIFSGNPGYIVGKPILMGTKLAKGNETFIQRNSSNFIDNFLTFPENVDGKCIRNETYNIPVEFGYNTMTKCRIQAHISYNVSQNATVICRNIQGIIFNIWGVPRQINHSLIFGLFGNAEPAKTEDWNEVLYRTDPNISLNQTHGNITSKNTTLTCYNLSTLLDVEMYYSRVDLKTVLNQNKILGVTFSFGNILNQSYALQKKQKSGSLDVSFGLVSQVSFHDTTSRKEMKSVDPPSFDIRLPYDFFYPFIKIGSGTKVIVPNVVLLILICILKYLFQ